MLPVANNTAPECDSIWKGLDEKTFRSTIAALSLASNGVPGDSRIYAVDEWERQRHLDDTSQRRLSLKDEQRLADDLAYIAVSRDGGKAVSAVALEENFYLPTLTVRLAANGYIPEQVPKELNAFLSVLRARANKGLHIYFVRELTGADPPFRSIGEIVRIVYFRHRDQTQSPADTWTSALKAMDTTER
ncbi:MAG: hypothetical protein Q9177_004081 [Variospora cf. flavescens]